MSTPKGNAVLWTGGAVLRADVKLSQHEVEGVGFWLIRATGGYSGSGWVTLKDEEAGGSAHGVFLGGTWMWIGGTTTFEATLTPHFVWSDHPQSSTMRAIGGQLRLRFGFNNGVFGSMAEITAAVD